MFRTARPHRGMTSAPLRYRIAGAVGALALGVGALTGCAAGQISQTADQIANVDGAQGSIGQVGVMNALLATPDGTNYPKGSQAPLTMWVSNDALTSDTLTGITTDAGTVTITGAAIVPAQSVLQIGGADAKVTAAITGLTKVLNYGISVPMTFSFEHAGDLKLNVPIEIPQQRNTALSTTNIYPGEVPNLWQTEESTPTNVTSPSTTPPTPSGPTESDAGPTTGMFDTQTGVTISTPSPAATG